MVSTNGISPRYARYGSGQCMAIEHAAVQIARKPWGVGDLHPWSSIDVAGDPVGELWFQRTHKHAPIPALLLKLLFTSEPLSIQVHPDDEFARSIGLPNGKTEAWYMLAAAPGARVAIGLKQRLTPEELGASIRDGSIANLTQWRPVAKGDIIFVPAGTIHAIGAGIVLAEIQQRSDTTFRLFDYGRQRELHEECAVAVSDAGPIPAQSGPRRLTAARTALITSQHFVIERIDLPACPPATRRNQARLSRYKHDAAPPHRRFRQLAAPPLRDRNLYDRPAAGDLHITPESRDLHRGDDRSWSNL